MARSPSPEADAPRTLCHVKLVGTDIDGTILPPSGEFSARTRAALAALAPAGIPLELVTARPPRWVDSIASALGVDGLAVCGNGAVVYDMGERTIVDAVGVPTETLLLFAERLREALPGAKVKIFEGLGHNPFWEEPEAVAKVINGFLDGQ